MCSSASGSTWPARRNFPRAPRAMATSSWPRSMPTGISMRSCGASTATIAACVASGGASRTRWGVWCTARGVPATPAGCSITRTLPRRTTKPATASARMPSCPANTSRSAMKTARCTRSRSSRSSPRPELSARLRVGATGVPQSAAIRSFTHGDERMRGSSNARTGGEILVDQLLAHGARHAFCVPGESYLAVLDAFHDRDVMVTVCRQEGGAAMMAEAVGKLTGRPGICFVTRGPGATNASPGVHIARQDSTPMILFVGQVARETRDREAFQELDYCAVFGTMAKWATEIDAVERIPEIVSRAFYTATNGRPGPVAVALPGDMRTERAAGADARPFEPVETWPGLTDMTRLQKLLWAAECPIVLLGGSRWSQTAWAAMGRFAERLQIPVATTFRRAHLFDATHPCYAGDLGIGPNPKLLARIQSADLIVLVGGRLGELPSQGYTLLGIPNPQIKLVHVHPGAEELGRVYRPDLAIHAAPTAFAAALEGLEPPAAIRWREDTRTAHADSLAWSQKPTAIPGAVNLGEIMVDLRDRLEPDAILCNGAGKYAGGVVPLFFFCPVHTQ